MSLQILNSQGKPIVLTERELLISNHLKSQTNALGYDIDITTLTTIMKKITEQKFYNIPFADYLPVKVGEGAWSQQLTTYRSFSLGDDFGKGVLNTGGNNSKLASGDAGVDSVNVKVVNWAKSIGWTLMDLQQASKAGNWDLVTAKEKARKQNWDLGIQKVALLGLDGDAAVEGLLTLSGLSTPNLSVIPGPISAMTADELTAFLAALIPAYRENTNRTAMPTHFIVPESDYLGLAAPSSSTFPLKSKLELISDALKITTMNPGFKILPLAYGDSAHNSLGKTRYVLLNYDEESVRMDIPVDYTSTLANSTDNFSFQNVGYGQFTGAKAYRPAEVLYFQY